MQALNNLTTQIADMVLDRIKQRDQSFWLAFSPILSVILGLLGSGLMMLLLGQNPVTEYYLALIHI